MKRILFLFALLTPFFLLAQSAQVSVEGAQKMLVEDAVLVDVRESDEVAELAYVSEGILQIPLSELVGRFTELPQDKKLIVACRSGKRSQKAIDQLAELGVTNTINLEGGILEWQGKGFPVIVDGVAPPAKACCSKGSSEGKSSCSGKSAEKACGSKEGKACCSGKKS